MDCKKHSSSNSAFIKVNEGSMYRDMGLAPAQSEHGHIIDSYIGQGSR